MNTPWYREWQRQNFSLDFLLPRTATAEEEGERVQILTATSTQPAPDGISTARLPDTTSDRALAEALEHEEVIAQWGDPLPRRTTLRRAAKAAAQGTRKRNGRGVWPSGRD